MTQRYMANGPVGVPSPDVPTPKAEQPLREVLVELWENTEKLFRQEIALGSAEIDTKIDRLKKETAAYAIAGALLHAALLTLVAALVLLLSQAVNAWLAALIVGVVLGGIGYALIKRQPKPGDLVPRRTIESVKKDVQTFTEATK